VPIRPVPGRRSRILQGGYEPMTNMSIALASTFAFLLVVALLIVNAPGWETVKHAFFNVGEWRDTFPLVARAFLLNVKMFLIAEVLILVFALVIAVLRGLPGPVFFPLRALAIGYTDFFRGIPTILVVYVLGFGAPGLNLTGVPTDPVFWGVVALVLVYSAYVSEVYRAGIESIHPSQEAAARSLGLTRGQALRFVILPQAVRRVIPPLLNDLIGLQKDTALVSVLGSVDALQQANINSAADFNYTPYLVAAFFFVIITIPLARFTDWLILRERRRRQAGGVA
jgi:polar amino acid transport system permease protein